MHITHRSYLTAGAAVLGAGAIALTPIQPVPNQLALAPHRVSDLTVGLASSIDPITPWVDTFKLAAQNVKSLAEFYLEQPFPLLNTIGANIGTYIKALPDFEFIGQSIADNIHTFFQAPWSPGDPLGEYISNAVVTTTSPLSIPVTQQFAFALLPTVLGDAYDKLEPIINFTATHYSGQLVGLIGPLLAPVIQLTRSFTAVSQYFQDGDVTGAINELINIPANVTNAVLNGPGYWDLTGVVNAIQPLPPEVKSIGLNLGGLVSPPVPAEGTVAEPTALNGGVLFDSFAANIEYKLPPVGPTVKVNDPGIPVSWFGSVIGLGQFLGDEMLVTPPGSAQAVTPAAAAATARTASAPAAAEAAPAIEESSPVAEPSAPVGALPDVQSESPAPQTVSDPAPKKQKTSAGNENNDGNGRAGHSGPRGKRHAA